MTDSPTSRIQLLTEQQVLDALRKEVDGFTLTKTADKYGLQPQQISDVLHGRRNLSKRMLGLLRFRLHRFFERLDP